MLSPPPPIHNHPATHAMTDLAFALLAVAGSSLAVAIPCLLIAFLCLRTRNNLKPSTHHHPRCRSLPISTPDAAGAPPDSAATSWSFYGGADTSLEKLSLADLTAATGGFSPNNIIGDGSFGFVYRAILPTGAAVAVKRLSGDGIRGAGDREFLAELQVLGNLSHPNLTRLLGYCAAGDDRILVYELLERGSLDAWLHGDAESRGEVLAWPARLRVARGAAAAIAFLHHGRRPPVLHRDIKSSNILIGEGFEAKLADFGLARIVKGSPAKSHVSTQAAGTAGYVAPEIWLGVGATAKADVYSFGVLVMEIVTGLRPNWPVKAKIGEEDVDMVDWAREKIAAGKSSDILDQKMGIGVGGNEMVEVKGLLEIAWQCTDSAHRNRPTMEEVVIMLNKI